MPSTSSPLIPLRRRSSTLLAAATLLASSSLSSAAAAPLSSSSPRTRTSLDMAWRFHLGPANAGQCNASSFPVPIPSTVQCLGLVSQPSANSIASCVAASCAGGDTLWQYSQSAGCWTGSTCANNLTSAGWAGGMSASTGNGTCAAGTPCDPSYDDSTWRVLNVPHDFVIEGQFNPSLDPGHGALPRNVSWYRQHFTLPPAAQGQLVWVTFGGVFRAADVYVNGAFVGHHEEGYTSFHFYIHNASAPLNYGGGQNVLAVYVDARQSELWCYEGGGIYRHVWLETASPLSMVPWSFFASHYVAGNIEGSDVTQPQFADSVWLLPQVDIQNAGSSQAFGSVTFTLYPPGSGGGGQPVLTYSAPFNVSGNGGWQRVSAGPIPFGNASQPVALWNTAWSPPLYTAVASISLSSSPGTVVDSLSTTVGFRSAVFDPRMGFVLNNVKTLIRGTSNHLGFGGAGMAVPDRVHEFQIATLKSMGANAWRTAHNPVAPELLGYADQYGMLVWDENRFVTSGVQPLETLKRYGGGGVKKQNKNKVEGGAAADAASAVAAPTPSPSPSPIPAADPQFLQDAQDMVLRDRNHPSIILYSLCNELGCVADSPTGNTLAAQFKEVIYAADSSRPITSNTVQTPYLDGHWTDPFARAMDVQSFSYEYDAYTAYHAAAPYKAVGGGESCSCVTDRGYYGPTDSNGGHVGPSARGGLFNCISSSWLPVVQNSFVFGNFAWTGFDYMGETYPLGWPDVSSHFGIFDLAGFPKDGVGYYRAWWSDEPNGLCGAGNPNVSLELSPSHWTDPVSAGSAIDVSVLTCAASVDLFVNGEKQGTNSSGGGTPISVPPFGVVSYPGVTYQPGNLTAVAYDSQGNVQRVRTILTAGAPAALVMWVEDIYNSGRNGSVIAADGEDVALIGVSIVDARGVMVPNAAVNVTFSITGPGAVVGVANGDPADHSPVKFASWRLTFFGLARAIIGSSGVGEQGDIVVGASVAGDASITPASVVLRAV